MRCSVLASPLLTPVQCAGTYRRARYPAGVSENSTPQDRPARITAAAVLTALEGLVIAALGLFSLVLLFVDRPDGMLQAAMLVVTLLALAVLPLVAARGLWLRRRWSRGPSMITQLLALPAGWQLAHNGGVWVVGGVAVGLTGLAVLACLVNPTATEALGIGPRDA
jgi:hypothetical protein